MQPAPAPSKYFYPLKNNVHISGLPFFISKDIFEFLDFLVLKRLVESVHFSSLSLENTLVCTSRGLLV
jgi:hypothetical protein